MPELPQGHRIGAYEIRSLLGRGGMGEVYRAHDPRLRRDVAIKILPDGLAGDADRLARFEREARVLAALTHPNIAAIYGVEDRALVLELVDGETLAERRASRRTGHACSSTRRATTTEAGICGSAISRAASTRGSLPIPAWKSPRSG